MCGSMLDQPVQEQPALHASCGHAPRTLPCRPPPAGRPRPAGHPQFSCLMVGRALLAVRRCLPAPLTLSNRKRYRVMLRWDLAPAPH